MIKPEITISRCGDCGVVERLLIHHIRHRGTFRRLCTSCVLRLHPHSFCPTCFQIYPPAPPNDAAVTCSKCYSSSHSQCTGATPPHPYICPLCVSPNSSIFKLKAAKDMDFKSEEEGSKLLDRESAKKLLAAARIASISMNRAAVAAKAEAERRAREAAVARKRAKEALQQVAYLVMKEKLRKRESGVVVGGPGFNMGMGMSKLKVESNGGGGSNVVPPPSMVAEKMDTSNQVLAALNSVELRETTETMMIGGGGGGVTPPPTDDDGVTDADDYKTADDSVEEFIIADGSSDNHDEIFADMEVDTKQDDDDDDDDDDDEGSLDKMLTDKMVSKVNGDKYEDDDVEEDEEDDDNDDDDDDDDDNNEDDV